MTEVKKLSKWNQAFTLIEMLIVMFVIGVLILLFAPNLSNHSNDIASRGDEAIVEVVKTQMELYKLNNDGVTPNEQQLVPDYLTQKQWDKYQEVINAGG
ncbi:competence type IV pilus major pilin ComGC [Enterococcus sp. HY326]|uniref:competence type IV pilus major pilin ComGC n=1 Tax=Enterococcus sp. HY326 TaxID=2971265 RepID=UPI00223F6767|nr:competence type IV pilus major pilin ComGC [Enterococcus sp. HY326]